MAQQFTALIALVFAHEGGFVDHPDDPGGATNMGITQKTYDGYCRARGLTGGSVRHISRDVAAAIYEEEYWRPIRGDLLPSGVDYVVLDGAVHSGVSRSSKWLQGALGVEADGQIGPITLGAAKDAEPSQVVRAICAERRQFLRSLKTYRTFGKGWERRVAEVEGKALDLCRGTMPAPPAQKADAKARPSDVSPARLAGVLTIAAVALLFRRLTR